MGPKRRREGLGRAISARFQSEKLDFFTHRVKKWVGTCKRDAIGSRLFLTLSAFRREVMLYEKPFFDSIRSSGLCPRAD